MTQRVYIFEGPDGVGKTTTAKRFAESLSLPYFKFSQEENYWREGKFKQALEFDQTYLVQFLEQTKMSVIIDRAWPSELVYSTVYGRETNRELLISLDERYAKMGACIVVCNKREFIDHPPDKLVDSSRLMDLRDEYSAFSTYCTTNCITLWMDGFTWQSEKKYINLMDALKFQQGRTGVKMSITANRISIDADAQR